MLRTVVFASIFAAFFFSPASIQTANARGYSAPDIVATLERDGRFGTLLFALEATGLDAVLAGDGRYTLFAPTDDAFAALPPGTIEALTSDEEAALNFPALTNILLYHVVAGKPSRFSLLIRTTATTVQGSDVIVTREGRDVLVNDSQFLGRPRYASNGAVNAIDAVLLPPEEPIVVDSILDFLKLDGRFGTLLFALEATGLDEALDDGSRLTLFAPTDEAFAALPTGTIEALIGPEEAAAGLLIRVANATLLGPDVFVQLLHRSVFVNDAQVIAPNARAGRGYVHIVDGVLIPPQ